MVTILIIAIIINDENHNSNREMIQIWVIRGFHVGEDDDDDDDLDC
jgi:hypothetical protein